jgi:isochorismate synthase EntC
MFMSSMSLAICRLPNQLEIQIFHGKMETVNMEFFQIPDNSGFLLTEGLDPTKGYFLSGEAHKVAQMEELLHELKQFIPHILKFQSGSAEISNYYSATFQEFSAEINAVKTAIKNEDVKKIVVARILKGEWMKLGNQKNEDGESAHDDFNKPVTSHFDAMAIQLYQWFQGLCGTYTDCMVYLLLDETLGMWIGASPELLLKQNEFGQAKTVSLAGTLFEDSENWSDKEKLEQSTTSQHVEEALNSMDIQFEISQLREQRNGHLRHLISEYQFNLNSEQVLPLMRQLNPTPAVIGYPQKKALEWVKANLNLNRELYSGAVGMISKSNTYLHVNLRCAKMYLNGEVNFYAGCGINLMSDPTREWEETELKSQVISRYL